MIRVYAVMNNRGDAFFHTIAESGFKVPFAELSYCEKKTFRSVVRRVAAWQSANVCWHKLVLQSTKASTLSSGVTADAPSDLMMGGIEAHLV